MAYEVPRRSHERHCDVFHASWLHTYTSASGMESPSSSPPQCTRKRCCDSFARPLRCSQSTAWLTMRAAVAVAPFAAKQLTPSVLPSPMTTTDRWPTRAATRLSSESGARPGTASNGVMSDAQLGWELCIVGHEVAVKVQVLEQDLSKRTKNRPGKYKTRGVNGRCMQRRCCFGTDETSWEACLGGLQYMSDACNPQTLIAGPLSCCCKKLQHLLPTSPSLRPRAASPTAPLR